MARHQPPLVGDAVAYLAAHGFVAIADLSGKHHKGRWTSSGRRARLLTLAKDPHGTAGVASLARLRRALESDGALR
jgi:hypothetical protein